MVAYIRTDTHKSRRYIMKKSSEFFLHCMIFVAVAKGKREKALRRRTFSTNNLFPFDAGRRRQKNSIFLCADLKHEKDMSWKINAIKRKGINNKSLDTHQRPNPSPARLWLVTQCAVTRVRQLRVAWENFVKMREIACAPTRESADFSAQLFASCREKTLVCLSYQLPFFHNNIKRNKNLCTSINCSVFIELCCVIVVIRVNIILKNKYHKTLLLI